MENNTIKVEVEDIRRIKDEAKGLLGPYAKEVGLSFDLKPNWEMYEALDDAGGLIVIAARDAGVLIGFAVFAVFPNINCKGELAAHCNSLYLHPNYRGGVGKQLIQLGDTVARNKGVDCVMITSQAYRPIDAMLEHMGYEKGETVFFRRV